MVKLLLLQQELLELLPIVVRRLYRFGLVLLHQNTCNERSMLGDVLIEHHMVELHHMGYLIHLHTCQYQQH